VNVLAYNSKTFYVMARGRDGDQAYRFPDFRWIFFKARAAAPRT